MSASLAIPANITLLPLPSRAPELNPVENGWQHPGQNWLSNWVFEDHMAIVDVGCDAWNKLMAKPTAIKAIASRKWATTGQM